MPTLNASTLKVRNLGEPATKHHSVTAPNREWRRAHSYIKYSNSKQWEWSLSMPTRNSIRIFMLLGIKSMGAAQQTVRWLCQTGENTVNFRTFINNSEAAFRDRPPSIIKLLYAD